MLDIIGFSVTCSTKCRSQTSLLDVVSHRNRWNGSAIPKQHLTYRVASGQLLVWLEVYPALLSSGHPCSTDFLAWRRPALCWALLMRSCLAAAQVPSQYSLSTVALLQELPVAGWLEPQWLSFTSK